MTSNPGGSLDPFRLSDFSDPLVPCAYQWQYFQEGAYALGIEPSTHHVTGDTQARARDEMIWLGPLEARSYDLTIRILGDAERCRAAEARIRDIAVQPEGPYPVPTGDFPALAGRGAPRA